jgi:hypothetical protein
MKERGKKFNAEEEKRRHRGRGEEKERFNTENTEVGAQRSQRRSTDQYASGGRGIP